MGSRGMEPYCKGGQGPPRAVAPPKKKLLAPTSQHFPITNLIVISCRPCVCYRLHLSYPTGFDILVINDDENCEF